MENHSKNKGNFIVLNRMYVGDYLSANLGHEVINMYTADNGRHYIYLNAYGSFAAKWADEIIFMSSGTSDNVKLCFYTGENLFYQVCGY
jgi:hypothetical protein